MRWTAAVPLLFLTVLATAASPQEKPMAPDYSQEALLSIFHDYYAEQIKHQQQEEALEYDFGYGQVGFRFHFPLLLPFDFMMGDGTSLRPQVSPFALLGVDFPYTPEMFSGGKNPKDFHKMLRKIEKRKAREREERGE